MCPRVLVAEESVTCPIFKQLTALKGYTFGTCSGGTSDMRVPNLRLTVQNIECIGAEQEVGCLSRKEEFELDFFFPVRHDFAMHPGLH